MEDWWAEIDDDILDCVAKCGALTPFEVGIRLGVSEAAATSLLARLAQEGKIVISSVALAAPEAARYAA